MMKASRELKRFDPTLSIEESVKPPYTWYIDEEFLFSEKEYIFQRSWIPVGRADQVPNNGDYFTTEILGNSFVVLKDKDGKYQGFHNVCRHNAAKVATGCGNCEELVCSYHGWVYDLNGSLKSAPHLGARKNFNINSMSLKKISVEKWGPFLFADLEVCESAQKGMESMSFENGIYSSKLEKAVHEFHKLVWKELQI